jgi:ABC-type multidrug transport system fused ATPase/permease subunit
MVYDLLLRFFRNKYTYIIIILLTDMLVLIADGLQGLAWIILVFIIIGVSMFFGVLGIAGVSMFFGGPKIAAASLPYNLERNPRYRIIVPIKSPGYRKGDVIGRTILFILSISMLYLMYYFALDTITNNPPILRSVNFLNLPQFIVKISKLYSLCAQSASSELSSAIMLVLITIVTFIFLLAYVMLFSAFIASLINIGAVIISVRDNNEVVFEFLLDYIYSLLDLDKDRLIPRVYKLRFTPPLKIGKIDVDLNTLSTYFKQSKRIGNFIVGIDKYPIPGYAGNGIIYAPINYKEGYVINGYLIVIKGFDKAVKELTKMGLMI